MLIRFFVIAVLLVILYCLGSALFFLIKQPPQSDCMVKALSWRIGLSVALFIFLLVTYFLGWITPHGI